MSSNLMHDGKSTFLVSREDLSKIEVPQGTDSWKPVPYDKIVNNVIECLGKHDLKVVNNDGQGEYAVHKTGSKFFGVLDLSRSFGDFRVSMGLRSSNDKSFSIQMILGGRVAVCDNGMFCGEWFALKRKHTSKLDLKTEIEYAVGEYVDNISKIENQVSSYKDAYIEDIKAKSIIHDVFFSGIMPMRRLIDVSTEYFAPEIEEFEDRNLWSLYNAFTSVAKKMPVTTRFEALTNLSSEFDRVRDEIVC